MLLSDIIFCLKIICKKQQYYTHVYNVTKVLPVYSNHKYTKIVT